MTPKVHIIEPGPDLQCEKVVRYYPKMAELCEKHFGRRPSRTTLHKYITRGFPIARGGPYVIIPVYNALGRSMTTTEAMQRFITVVRKLKRDNRVNPSVGN